MKHFISLHHHDADTVRDLLSLAVDIKANPSAYAQRLAGKTLAMVFQKASTRTRVSFEVGIYQLGGIGLFLRGADLQLGRGEPISDTAAVLGRYVHAIMARTNAHDDVLELAAHSPVPVINGLTDLQHPCQALADLLTIHEVFGKTEGLKLAYIGDGNNMAHSLLFACCKAGMDFSCATPQGYEMNKKLVAIGRKDTAEAGNTLLETHDPAEAVRGANVVYTDVWASMGQEEEHAQRLKDFRGFQVDAALLEQAEPDAVFMHCLPAHRGEEVSAEVCDGPKSIIYDQAENRLHAQKAILVRLMAD